jgi:cell division protein FtsL
MTRVNLVLLALLIISALGTVAAQHKSRRLFAELEREQAAQRRLDIEFRQLQLEQSTWAMHARIEKVALAQLKMQMPPQARVQVVERDPAAAKAVGAAVTGPANPAGPRTPGAALPAASGQPAGAPQ